MHEAGYASQPQSIRPGDGLELKDAWVTAAVRCAPPDNKPTTEERNTCEPFIVEELALLGRMKVVITLGGFAHTASMRALQQLGVTLPRPRPKFGHASVATLDNGLVILGCYHPSQQNTFTGRLTMPMLVDIFQQARSLTNA
jgi:uracil-DNA glycosylase family 4